MLPVDCRSTQWTRGDRAERMPFDCSLAVRYLAVVACVLVAIVTYRPVRAALTRYAHFNVDNRAAQRHVARNR